MKNSTRFVLIIALLVLSWWLQNLLDTKPELITREKTRFANYFLEDFKLTTHNKQGEVKYVLSAKRLDNYDDEDLAEIQQINLQFINNEANWTLTAGKGRLFHSNKQIEFYDDVKINRPATNNSSALQVSTDKITLLGDAEKLQTDEPVTVVSDGTTLQSQGLVFDNQKGTLELKSNVKGQYVK